MYRCFVRNWWKLNPSWPGGLEPDGGAPKRTIAKNVKTEAEARRICQEYNATHKPGRLSRKAEYEEQ
jgi:hypothetical protein